MDKKDEFLLARVEEACQNNYAPQFFDFQDEAMQLKMENIFKIFWRALSFLGRNGKCW